MQARACINLNFPPGPKKEAPRLSNQLAQIWSLGAKGNEEA